MGTVRTKGASRHWPIGGLLHASLVFLTSSVCASAGDGILSYFEIGEYQGTGVETVLYNDNFLFGLLSLEKNLKRLDGNDRGYTHGADFGWTYLGTKGKISISKSSHLWTQLIGSVDREGDYPIAEVDFVELNQIRAEYQSYPDEEGDYLILTFTYNEYTNRETSGNARHQQDQFHELLIDTFSNIGTIQYDYRYGEMVEREIVCELQLGQKRSENSICAKCYTDARAGIAISTQFDRSYLHGRLAVGKELGRKGALVEGFEAGIDVKMYATGTNFTFFLEGTDLWRISDTVVAKFSGGVYFPVQQNEELLPDTGIPDVDNSEFFDQEPIFGMGIGLYMMSKNPERYLRTKRALGASPLLGR